MTKNRTLRITVVFFNIILCFLGVIFLIIGIYRLKKSPEYGDLNDTYAVGPALATITLGLLSFLGVFWGLFGVFAKSNSKLWIAGIIYMILFTLSLCIAVVFTTSGRNLPRKNLQPAIMQYHTSKSHKLTWDTIQESYKCCGIDGPTDYFNWGMSLPLSCCSAITIQDRAEPHLNCSNAYGGKNLNMYGCYTPLRERAKSENTMYVILGFIATVVVAITYVASITYANCLKNEYRYIIE